MSYKKPNPLPRPKKNNMYDIAINDNLPAPIPRDNKIDTLNSQLNEVTNILNDNIDKTINNMDNTVSLSQSTDDLREYSASFNTNARKAKRKMYFKNKKLQALIGGIVVVIIIIIFV